MARTYSFRDGQVLTFLQKICLAEENRRRRQNLALTMIQRIVERRGKIIRYLSMLSSDMSADALAWLATTPDPRRYWVRPRERSFWNHEVLHTWDDDMWLSTFRMSRETLFEIANQLRPEIERKRTIMRNPITVEERVAITIHWLATPLMYLRTAETFGLGSSTVAEIAVEVCLAIEKILLRKTVQLGDYRQIMSGFEALGFPHCVGAVDGTHIPVCAPSGRGHEFINRKDGYSILLQGTVDHTGRFIDSEIGYTGRNHDSHVFRYSALRQAMDAGEFVPGNPTITLFGVQVPPIIIADSAYPLSRWLMKPYGGKLDRRKKAFNMALCRARSVVERAFGRLKSRWRCLTSRLTVSEENFVPVISACVVLHNICESRGHILSEEVTDPEILLLPECMEHYRPYNDGRAREGALVQAALARLIAGDP